MERKNGVRKPRLRARCKNSSKIHCPPPDPSFLIASLLWIAELEDIQGLNSKRLAELLGVRYFCLDILYTFLCHCVILVPFGDRCDRRGGIRFLVPPSQQWHLDRINHFLCPFWIVQQKYTRQIVEQKIYKAVDSND